MKNSDLQHGFGRSFSLCYHMSEIYFTNPCHTFIIVKRSKNEINSINIAIDNILMS